MILYWIIILYCTTKHTSHHYYTSSPSSHLSYYIIYFYYYFPLLSPQSLTDAEPQQLVKVSSSTSTLQRCWEMMRKKERDCVREGEKERDGVDSMVRRYFSNGVEVLKAVLMEGNTRALGANESSLWALSTPSTASMILVWLGPHQMLVTIKPMSTSPPTAPLLILKPVGARWRFSW